MTGSAERTQKIIIITGPTASGKTAFSLELAAAFGGEIINADVGQFYTPLSIGTAKPDLAHCVIPHHLFNIVSTPDDINVTMYRQLVLQKIAEICARGKTPILVGGSLFYIKSLFFPPLNLKPLDSAHAVDVEALYAQMTTQELWNILYAIDAVRAQKLYVQDRYRIMRALFLWHTFGKKPSECEPLYDFDSDVFMVFIKPEQSEHKKNIALRVGQMLDEGWVAEAEALMNTRWKAFLDNKGLIGYPEIFIWIEKGKRAEEKQALAQIITQKTWQYARRQLIFWTSFKKQLMAAHKNASKQCFLEIEETSNCASMLEKTSNFLKKNRN